MSDTYCGKSCEQCQSSVELKCPGCKAGPGSANKGECSIVRCCLSKGHADCQGCYHRGNCPVLRQSVGMAEQRLRVREREREKQEQLLRDMPVLGKWISVLFWIAIANEAVGLFLSVFEDALGPGVTFWGLVPQILLTGYGIVLVMLSSVNVTYKMAGVCTIAAAIGTTLQEFLSNSVGLSLVLGLAAMVFALVSEYNECIAHAEMADRIDQELGEKWRALWYWHLGSIGAMIAGMVLILIFAALGALIVMAASVALLVTAILKFIRLYKTAQAFRNYADYFYWSNSDDSY